MELDDFIKKLNLNISEKEIAQLLPMFTCINLDRNESFINYDDPSSRFALIEEGIFKLTCYNESKNKDVIKLFSGAGEFIGPYADFLRNRMSQIKITSITKSRIYSCDFSQFIQLSEAHLPLGKCLHEITKNLYLSKEEKEYELLCLDARERLKRFETKFKPYLREIPQYLIADYLNISPSYLSTINKQLQFHALN